MSNTQTPLFTVTCVEPEGEVDRSVYPLEFTPANLQKFWDAAKQFNTIYGKELHSVDDFISMFMSYDENGDMRADGLFFCVPEADWSKFVGVFYITNIIHDGTRPIEADVHYSFFDRRHRGRVPLVKQMLKYAFEEYGFQRFNATVPLYASKFTRHFVTNVGFKVEGIKRAAAFYEGQWFNVMQYGILRSEVLSPEVESTTSAEVTSDGNGEN